MNQVSCVKHLPFWLFVSTYSSITDLVNLAVGVDTGAAETEERRLELATNTSLLSKLEVTTAASGAPYPAAEPRGSTESKAEHAAHAEVGVFGEGHADVEEDLLEARDGQFGLDLGRRRRDLVKGLQDRGTRGHDGVAGDGVVPVLAVL